MVEILIPWHGGCADRERALQWVRDRYPWPVTIAPGSQPWSKGAAVMPAIANSTADIVVIADADVWSDGIDQAVDEVTAGSPWAVPHRGVHRLTEAATTLVIAGTPWHYLDTAERPYGGVLGGGIVVIHRALALACPLDPRFIGWGGEDESWGWALTTMLGPPARTRQPLVHLWHRPQDRVTRSRGSRENWMLRQRYARATGNPNVMAQLLAEARLDQRSADQALHHHAA